MSFLKGLKEFDKSKLQSVETVVRTFEFVEDTSLDNLLAQLSDGLFVGSAGGASNFVELKNKEITHILNLAPTAVKNFFKDDFIYMTLNVLDLPKFQLDQYFEDCIDFISSAVESKGRCFVHCNAGVSRSVTICIAYLMKTEGLDFTSALEKIRLTRPQAQPNEGFVEQLKRFHRKLETEKETEKE